MEGQVEVGYTFPHDASRKSKDAAVLTEDQIEYWQESLTTEKEYPDPYRTWQDKGKKGQGGRGKKEESKWDQPAPGAEGAEVQGSDPHVHGYPLEWGSHLKLLGSKLTTL